MTILTVGWTPTVNAMLPPQHPGDGDTGLLTTQWVARRGTTYYPYTAEGFSATKLPVPATLNPPTALPDSALAVALPVAGLAVAAAVMATQRRRTADREVAAEPA